MKKVKTDFLKDYWQATNDVAYKFIKKYFGKDEADLFIENHPLTYSNWIDYETRRIIQVSDYFFDMDFMIKCLMWQVKKDDMFQYYDYRLETRMNNEDLEEEKRSLCLH